MSAEENSNNRWQGYKQILLPMGHKADVNNLTNLASLLVDKKEGSIEFVHILEEGNYTRLPHEWRTGSKRVTESHHKMMKRGIHSEGQIKTARSILTGILSEAEEINADAIILGWGPKPKSSISNLASNIMSKANCDVIVFKTRDNPSQIDNIIYPVAVKPSVSRLRLIARYIGDTNAELTLLHVTDESSRNRERSQELLDNAAAEAEEMGINAETRLEISGNAVEKIAEVSRDFDLMILGPSGGWWLRRTLFGHKTDKIAVNSHCSVLLHKAAED